MDENAEAALSDTSSILCKRCAENAARIVVRHEHLCNDCFVRYVETKIVKRMESFRVGNSAPYEPRGLLLAMSFGASSLAVLHVLDKHLQRQIDRTGRPGYIIHVFHVTNGDHEAASKRLRDLQHLYPRHSYHPPDGVGNRIARLDAGTRSNFNVHTNKASGASPFEIDLGSVPPTSQKDIEHILLEKAIKRKADALQCEGVLWGHSTTKLAEIIMAETAKGRGFSLPWLANDGELPQGLVSVHPAKDLLRKELFSYWQMISTPANNILNHIDERRNNISIKKTSIDQLMGAYFGSVEENYPHIVANVLRTSAKLNRPRIDESTACCIICEMHIPRGEASALYNLGDNPSETNDHKGGNICYGCARSTCGSRIAEYTQK